MRRLLLSAVVVLVVAGPLRAAEDALARARRLYNQGDFMSAIAAADQARLTPDRADDADLVAARAYLERYRESAAADDLSNARERLRRLKPDRFPPRERVEYIIGLGETLYFDGAFGAAAEVLDPVLDADTMSVNGRERVLDWWADSIDRDARDRSDIERQPLYERVRARMRRELERRPGSAVASYWMAAAARGQGDTQAAWEAAQAAWIRSPLAGERAAALRADLDRLMSQAIIPERAKVLARPPESLEAEWQAFKEQWSR